MPGQPYLDPCNRTLQTTFSILADKNKDTKFLIADQLEQFDCVIANPLFSLSLNIARYVQKPLAEETITVEEALLDFKENMSALEEG